MNPYGHRANRPLVGHVSHHPSNHAVLAAGLGREAGPDVRLDIQDSG